MALIDPRRWPQQPEIRHCRDERISTSKEPICKKTVKSSAEMILNVCGNCGRPLFDEGTPSA